MKAQYLDGNSAAEKSVEIFVVDQSLVVYGLDTELVIPIDRLKVQERFASTPRIVRLPNAGVLKIDIAEDRELLAMLHGKTPKDLRIGAAFVLKHLVTLILAIVAIYYLILPRLASYVAQKLPEHSIDFLGEKTLSTLDKWAFSKSHLSNSESKELDSAFSALGNAYKSRYGETLILVKRHGGRIGANALALPGGMVVVTDELVKLGKTRDAILSVIAHEAGHHQHRHMLQQVLQGSIVSLVIAMVGGDVGSLASGLAAGFLQAKYSRKMETEADIFAANMLKDLGLSPIILADMLEALQGSANQEARVGEDWMPSYLSSHPATIERVKLLRDLK